MSEDYGGMRDERKTWTARELAEELMRFPDDAIHIVVGSRPDDKSGARVMGGTEIVVSKNARNTLLTAMNMMRER